VRAPRRKRARAGPGHLMSRLHYRCFVGFIACAVAVVLAVSLVAALLASLVPARAAAKRDPLEGLRYE